MCSIRESAVQPGQIKKWRFWNMCNNYPCSLNEFRGCSILTSYQAKLSLSLYIYTVFCIYKHTISKAYFRHVRVYMLTLQTCFCPGFSVLIYQPSNTGAPNIPIFSYYIPFKYHVTKWESNGMAYMKPESAQYYH